MLRVPVDRFDPALKAASGIGGGKVTSRAVNGQDVTPEYIDLNARLTNLRAQEKVLLRLMDEAATVTDTIRVQSQLSDVQGAIEQLEGRVRYLRDQASMSTITLSLTQAGAVPAAPSEPNAISQAFRDAGSYCAGRGHHGDRGRRPGAAAGDPGGDRIPRRPRGVAADGAGEAGREGGGSRGNGLGCGRCGSHTSATQRC